MKKGNTINIKNYVIVLMVRTVKANAQWQIVIVYPANARTVITLI